MNMPDITTLQESVSRYPLLVATEFLVFLFLFYSPVLLLNSHLIQVFVLFTLSKSDFCARFSLSYLPFLGLILEKIV